MKNGFFISIYLLLFSSINPQFLRFLQQKSSTNSYDYSNYNAQSTNQNLSSKTLESTTKDQSVVYITKSGISISNSNLKKTSGDSSNTGNSEFYGVNAAVLVQGGEATITGGTISTSAKGSNAVCATNNGKITITGTKITSTASGSARGLHSTFGGTIIGSNLEISTNGGSCATLATDRGEGKVSCSGCTLSTGGAGSPLIYSTGEITINKTNGKATGAQMVVVEGKNTANVLENSDLKCNGIGNRNNVDKCGVFLYQSMSGDAASGTSTFNCKNSKMEILSSSSVYSSAPMFFITNTDTVINLESCSFSYGSKIFLSAQGTTEWGNTGSNGGVVTLNLKNQNIEGDFIIDANSAISINLINSQIKGAINAANTAAKLVINLDKNSSISLTGNSYYTSITNEDSTGKNINYGTFSFTKTNEKEISRNSNNQNGNPPNASGTPPNASGTPPNFNGNPPNASGTPPNFSGNPPNASGNQQNASGFPPNFSGNPPNTSGTPPNFSGNPPNASGTPPNFSGNPPNASGTPPNASGTPPNASGTPPNASGTPPNASGTPPNASGTPPNFSGNPPNASGTPPNASGTPPNASGNPPNASGTPPNFSSNSPNGNGNPSDDNSKNEEEDEEFIAKYFSSQNFIKISLLLFLTILF